MRHMAEEAAKESIPIVLYGGTLEVLETWHKVVKESTRGAG
jgi:UDP-N-acetyl-D-mannosaminuronic acid transferase (WecB/TagA/CpsF family)